MTDKELMLKGELYIPANDPQLAKDCARSRRITRLFNVTRDIPDGVVAAGNPCRVLRKVTEEDRKYWEAEREKYDQTMNG